MRIKFLIIFLFLSALIHAAGSNTFYGTGNTGQLYTDQCCSHDATANGSVTQPSSPAPPEGDKWFSYGGDVGSASCGNYVAMNVLALPNGSQGSIYFWSKLQTTAINFDSMIFTGSTVSEVAGQYFIIRSSNTGQIIFQELAGFGTIAISGFADDTDYHFWRFRWGSFGAEIYKDGSLIGSDSTPATTMVLTKALLLDSPGFGFGTCALSIYIDAFQISTNPDATYLGPTSLSSPTPTYTITPTSTYTFTITPTPTYTPTPSNTPASITTPLPIGPSKTRDKSFSAKPTPITSAMLRGF